MYQVLNVRASCAVTHPAPRLPLPISSTTATFANIQHHGYLCQYGAPHGRNQFWFTVHCCLVWFSVELTELNWRWPLLDSSCWHADFKVSLFQCRMQCYSFQPNQIVCLLEIFLCCRCTVSWAPVHLLPSLFLIFLHSPLLCSVNSRPDFIMMLERGQEVPYPIMAADYGLDPATFAVTTFGNRSLAVKRTSRNGKEKKQKKTKEARALGSGMWNSL